LGVKEVKDPERFGIAEVENGFVKKLVEKPKEPKGNLALVGLYYIKSTQIFRECLDEIVQKKITTQGEYQLTDALQLMIERGIKFKTFPVEGWYDCGKKGTLLETNRILLEKLRYAPPRLTSTEIIQPVYIASTARITESVIGPNVTITERTAVDNSKIKNSILWEGCRVKNAALHDSLIGQNAVYRGSSKFDESQSLNLGGND
ncbi:MAG: nucleotidyl transferase, partial [candidate division Zixibacteria bacterium]|nr:nucleotidyl transferase [candidate division Zixibacteria bacterium]